MLVDRRARPVVVLRPGWNHLGAGGVQNLVSHLVHVAHHLHLVLAERDVDVHQRHPVAIGPALVDGHPVVRTRQHLAIRVERGQGGITLLDPALEAGAELQPRHQLGNVDRGGLAAVLPHLDPEPAQVVEPAQPVVEARDITVPAADPVVVRIPLPEDLRQEAVAVEPHLLAVVPPKLVAAVSEPGGVPCGPRIEQETGRIHRGRRHDDRPRAHRMFDTALALEIPHPRRTPLVVGQDARRHGAGDDLEPPALERRQQQVVGRVEKGRRATPRPARTAVVARRAAVVRPGQHRPPRGDRRNSERLGRFRQNHLGAARLDRRQVKAAAGQRVRVVVAAGHSDKLLHPVVIRRDVGIADGPRDVPAVARRTGEVEIRHAQADPAPDVGLAAPAPGAPEVERPVGRGQIRLLSRAQPKLRRHIALPPAPVRFERQHMRPRLAAIELPAGVEHKHPHAVLHEGVGGHGARGAAADDDDVMHVSALQHFHAAIPAPCPASSSDDGRACTRRTGSGIACRHTPAPRACRPPSGSTPRW